MVNLPPQDPVVPDSSLKLLSLPPVPKDFEFPPTPEVLERLSRVIPGWVASWTASATVTGILLQVEPQQAQVDEKMLKEFVYRAKAVVSPLVLRVELPSDVTTLDGEPLSKGTIQLLEHRPDTVKGQIRRAKALLRLSSDELRDKFSESLPSEVRCLRVHRYRIVLPNGDMDFFVVRLRMPSFFRLKPTHVQDGKDELEKNRQRQRDVDRAVREWRTKLEEDYGINLFLSRSEGAKELQHSLRSLMDKDGVVRRRSLRKIDRMLDDLCGPRPTEAPELKLPLPNREDLTGLHFVAIDADGCQDREDVVYATRLRSGNIKVMVAFTDVTDYVHKDSPWFRYAQRVGHTLYGCRHKHSTIGDLASTVGNFALNESRAAWVVEFVLDGSTGENLTRHWPIVRRAWVKAKTHISPEHLTEALAAGEKEGGKRFSLLAEAASLLRHNRMKSQRIIRIDGNTKGDEILAEMMVAAKASIGEYLHKSGMPAIWRTQAMPSEAVKGMFLRAVKDATGVDLSLEDLDDPARFASVIRVLEDHESARERSLGRQYLEMSLPKTIFSDHNEGHFGTGQPYFIELKCRDASGLVIQNQLHAACSGATPISSEEVRSLANTRNQKKAQEDERRYKAITLEAIQDVLPLTGIPLKATLCRRQDGEVDATEDGVFVNVDGIRWRVRLCLSQEQRHCMIGDSFWVTVDGYNVEKEAFQAHPALGSFRTYDIGDASTQPYGAPGQTDHTNSTITVPLPLNTPSTLLPQ